MELCLLNLLILIDGFFLMILTLVSSLRACNMWLTMNHMFICEIWGKFISFIFWNLSQISLLNMWLLVQICCIFSEHLFSRTPLSGCFWLEFNWFFFLVFVIPDILKAWIIFHSSSLGFLRKSLPKVFFFLAQLGFGILYMFIAFPWMQI